MASHSSSTVWEKDVFVSFRGEDVRKTFVSHLFCEFDRLGINAFRDNLDLERGKSISPELVHAITSSRFAIVVVSRSYAASSWCLNELLKIMECIDENNQTVVPVFYEVNPSDVRRQTGSFGVDLESHNDKEKVKNWREALTKLAEISGEDSRNWRDESKLIKRIVKEISDKLFSTSCDDDSKGLIGMSSHMDFLQSMMSIEDDDVRMVGIWGMGGVGKTTIAKYLYNQLSCRFQVHCYMDNVKEVCNRYGVRRLQGEFLCRMFRDRDKEAWSSVSCSSIIKERFKHKRVLIVLDDVDSSEQLNELVKETDWFGPGSRIIVTTRDRYLLVSHGIDLVYKMKCLPKKEALQLFCNYAFRNEIIIPHRFRELTVRAINYASGLPLALRVLGSFLYRRSQREWESTLARLETYPHSDIMEVLRVSYDGLDEQEKAIFLYISCFYNMKHVDYVTKLLDICGYAAEIGIRVLEEKSLIVLSNGFMKMHDLLEQIGRELVRQQAVYKPAERLLLWDPEDICELLSEHSGTPFVEGMSLNMSEISEIYASNRAFEGLSNLKLLNFYDLSYDGESRVHLPNGLSYLPRKLCYLRWDGYPLKTMPSRFHPEFLVKLCITNSNLEKLWDGIQPLRKLKKMDLSCCKYLVEIPDLSKATNLEELNLCYCESLVEVTPTIKNLQRLSCFNLTNCIQLQNIPCGTFLMSLETVLMSGCSSLLHFPEISLNTRKLYLNSTKIEKLPSSFSHLSCLVELDMQDCQSLRILPSSVSHLVSLKSMNLGGCKHLQNLPETFHSLTSLETLEVSSCLDVNEFPHVATNIEVLRISETSIEEIPARICKLSQLRSLDISENKRLKSLPVSISELRSLERLKLSGCSILESFPSEICQTLSCLRWFDLDRTSIKELPENIGNLIALEVLQARRTAIRRVPLSIARLTRLQVLAIGNSFYYPECSLQSLFPHLSRFDDLRALCLSNMKMIEIPNSIGKLWNLSELDLSGNDFEFIPASIKRLNRLIRLDLNNCQRLQALPDELPRSLLYIYTHGCTSLVSISGCFKHHCLRKLVASNCYKLDQEAQILIHRNMQLGSAKPEYSYFPGRDVPSSFNHQAMGPSLSIHLPQSESSSDILGFSTCIMIGVNGQYRMHDLKIRGSCILKGIDACELTVMDELWYPDPKAFRNMCFGSDHLLLFSRTCTSMGAYKEVLFEFSIENTKGDSSNPLGEVKKCAVHLITFKDMMQEQISTTASLRFSNETENIHNPDSEFSEVLEEAGTSKRRPYETELLYTGTSKRNKFRPVPLARKRHSKLHQPNIIRE